LGKLVMLGPLVELAGNHGGGDVLAAAIDRELRAGLGDRDWNVGQADRAADADPRATAGDRADHRGLAGAQRPIDDRVAVARDRASLVGDLEAGEPAGHAALLLFAQRLHADELAVQLDPPAPGRPARR